MTAITYDYTNLIERSDSKLERHVSVDEDAHRTLRIRKQAGKEGKYSEFLGRPLFKYGEINKSTGKQVKGSQSYYVEFLTIFAAYEIERAKSNKRQFLLPELCVQNTLNLSRNCVWKMVRKAKMLGHIVVQRKAKVKPTDEYLANWYRADLQAIEDYAIEHLGISLLETMDPDTYFKVAANQKAWLKANVVQIQQNAKVDESGNIIEQQAKQARVRKKLIDKLDRAAHEPFLQLLKTMDTYGLQFRYLDDKSSRLNNPICNTLNERHTFSVRKKKILEAFQSDENELKEFDVNASIYRLSYALGNGKPCSHDVDIYEEVFHRCNFNTDVDFKDIRQDFKQLFMPIYMREHSIRWNCMQYDYKHQWTWFANDADEEFVKYYDRLTKACNCDMQTMLTTVRDTLHDFLGLPKFYKAEIFVHESDLHILMLSKLQAKGLKVINVYDGFYFEQSAAIDRELFNSIYDQCIEELLAIHGGTK